MARMERRGASSISMRQVDQRMRELRDKLDKAKTLKELKEWIREFLEGGT